MSKARKDAPVGVVVTPYRDERSRVVSEYNQRDPEYCHVWAPVDSSADELAQRGLEVVRENGRPVTNGVSVLCRLPREVADRPFISGSQASLQRLQAIAYDQGSDLGVLRRRAEFKPVPGTVDVYGNVKKEG